MEATDLCYTPATQLAAAVRTKQVSPVEVIDAVLARLERLNPTINAYCTMTAELARTTLYQRLKRRRHGCKDGHQWISVVDSSPCYNPFQTEREHRQSASHRSPSNAP